MKKVAFISAFFALLLTPGVVLADYETSSPKQQIIVDKQLKSPLDANWHDNLGSDNTFAGNDFIEFKIIVKNTGDHDLTNIKVTDYLPSYVVSVYDPGVYDSKNQTIKWTIDRLTPGQEVSYLIKVEVVDSSKLPNSGTFCNNVNKVEVTSDQGPSDSDTAQFCLNPRVLGATLPESGSPLLIGTVIASSLLGLGIVGRKFGRGELFS